MGRAEVGTPKYIANKMKAKGLQKLRWYCQMCQKQCRDENGFKCHTMSESHQRQLLLFGENSGRYIDQFSREFASGYLDILSRQFGTKRVSANKVYQEYISDKNHLHMNSTKWVTLTGFVKWLGREGHCVVDDTEKGWFITYIDRDPATIARQEAAAKKQKMDKDDQEKTMDFIEKQVERGQKEGTSKESCYTELQRENEEEKIVVELKKKVITTPQSLLIPSNALDKRKADDDAESVRSKRSRDESCSSRKMSALAQIINEERRRKEIREEREKKKKPIVPEKPPEPVAWIREKIVVKVITDTLGEKYLKKKGYIKRVIDGYGAEVVMLDSGDKLKLDQDHLETVIPNIGRVVIVVMGRRKGDVGELLGLEDGGCLVKFEDKELVMEYNEVCKIHEAK